MTDQNNVITEEQTKAVRRLREMKADESLVDFHIIKGEDWDSSTPHEKAKAMNEILDAIENGDYYEAKNIDSPFGVPMPKWTIEDMKANNFRFKRYKVLNWFHIRLGRIEDFYLYRKHKVKKFFLGNYHKKN